jgi:Tol biopolymer transport system component
VVVRVLAISWVLACAGCALDRAGLGGATDVGALDVGADAPADGGADGAVPRPDGPTDAGGSDAGSDAGRLDLGPFGPPSLVSEVSSPAAADDDPSLTADQLWIVFNSDRSGNGDIYYAKRPTLADRFEPPMPLAEANTTSTETTPRISADGLTLWFSSTRGGGAHDLYVMTRPATSGPWSMAVPATELNSSVTETSPWPSPDGLRIAFDSDRAGDFDLYEASRESVSAAFAPPRRIASVSTPDREVNPALGPDFLEMWFASVRAGTRGQDILFAFRRTQDAPFETPRIVDELASAGNDDDPWISEDLRTIYFASDRTGNSEIYRATR